ncbi:pentapeptide repeat-containing protein [Candidatus Woesearchaeota archaeon]|nr:pentapeptide repeat-containing protein [Candidatus Woesearchaeota archaeon]
MAAEKDITLSELMEIIDRKDNHKITEILTKFKDRWNVLMEENRRLNHKLHIRDLMITGQDLSGVDLSDTVIEDSDFSDSDLSGSDLGNSTITGTKLSGTNLEYANLNSARITQSDMSKARLYKSNFNSAYFTGSVNLFDAYLNHEEEHRYSTSPDITKEGFRHMEYYEHRMEEGDDEDHGYY